MHIFHLLRSQRSRLRTPRSTELSNPVPVSGEHSSSRPSSPDVNEQGRLSASEARDDLAGQSATAAAIVEPSNLRSAPANILEPTSPLKQSDLSEHHVHLAVPEQSRASASMPFQEPLATQPLTLPSPHQPQKGAPSTTTRAQNIFDSRNVSVVGNMNTVIYTNDVVTSPHNFMKELLEKTILGAAFDSSTRDPPPRCHPETRLATLERCVHFILNCCNTTKMRWVFGVAGVGKSAIMQSIAESPLPSVTFRASIFFFTNGRSDGSKAIVTLAYQFAAKCDPYRQFIEHEITRDPSLLYSSLSVQFDAFIVKPFIHYPQLSSAGRILIIIDGLDECSQLRTQQELLRLISEFCLAYPSSPVIWMIASRPEPHIRSFFAQASVQATYEKEEIPIDSNEARADVERFLRIELTKMKMEFSLNPSVPWPSEQDFWKLANASGGLFVYARTVIKYIGNPYVGNPTLQFRDVLKVIDAHPLLDLPRDEHPMALLDALYSQILSKVPLKVKQNTRKFLLALAAGWKDSFDWEGRNFIMLCNWLGMTSDEAYAALRHLSSVLRVPGRDRAHNEELRYFHKSFLDYIFDYSRSEFSHDITHEAHQLYVQCALRILEQAPNGISAGDFGHEVYSEEFKGVLTRGFAGGANVSLTWPVDEGSDWDDLKTKLYMYIMTLMVVVEGIRHGQQVFCTSFCIRFLATRFHSFNDPGIPNLHEVVFDKSRRHELIELGLLHQLPVQILNFRRMMWHARLRFNHPSTQILKLSDPWNRLCEHRREGKLGKGQGQAWSTSFTLHRDTFGGGCHVCCRRLERQLEKCKTRHPNLQVSVLFTSAGVGLVEFQFADLEDGMGEWTYWLWHKFSEEKRKRLGSTI